MPKRVWLGVLLLSCAFLVLKGYTEEKEEVVFSGVPVVKISEGGLSRLVQDLDEAKSQGAKCTIVRVGGKYFWKTRDNIELQMTQSGVFVTFVASSGAGYIRVIPPQGKNAASLMDETEKKFDYVEHMLIGLRSVTYYGKSK